MSLRVPSSITNLDAAKAAEPVQAASGAGPAASPPAGVAGDGILISRASTAVAQLLGDRATKIEGITASVRAGVYQTSSVATGNAIVAWALAGQAGAS